MDHRFLAISLEESEGGGAYASFRLRVVLRLALIRDKFLYSRFADLSRARLLHSALAHFEREERTSCVSL